MIALTQLRELTLAAPVSPERGAYLSAASGLVKAGEFLYVVADDELQLGVFPAEGDAAGRLIRLFGGTLPVATEARKQAKADLEALLHLPPFGGYAAGALLCLPSGSKPNRHVGALLALDPCGAVIGLPRAIDCSAVYASLARELPALNIEGAAVYGGELTLMQRGNHRNSVNACVHFALPAVLDALASSDALRAAPSRIAQFELGDVDGVRLCFSDVAAVPGIGFAFTAIAEDTEDNSVDGRCAGSAVGIIDDGGRLRYIEQLTGAPKVEGIHAEIAGQLVQLWLVTDADDESTPAQLLTAEVCID